MTFKATLELHGKTATGIQVPPEIVTALNSGQRPKILATIGPHTYRTSIAPYTGQYFIPVSAENREAAGIKAGEEVEVTVELDTAPREVEVPDDFAGALDEHNAREKFDKLSFSHKREHVEAILKAKAPETRQRRIEKAIEMILSK